MRYLFLLFALVASVFTATAQTGSADVSFVLVAEYGTTAVLTDSTWRVNCKHPISQLGQGYLPTQIVEGHVAFDAYGRRYRVLANESSNFGSSTLVVVELQDNNLAPSGVGVVYAKPSDSDQILIDVAGNTGLSPSTVARIHIHNILNGGGSGSGIDTRVDSLIALTGVPANSTNIGAMPFPGLNIDNTNIKTALTLLAVDTWIADGDKSSSNEGRLTLLPTYSLGEIDRVALRSNTSGTKDIVFVPGTGIKFAVSTVSNAQDSLTIEADVIADNVAATPFGSITANTVQGQIEQAADGVFEGNIYYVSPFGTALGAKGKRNRPYKYSRSLDTIATPNDLIYFLPGEYKKGIIGSGDYLEYISSQPQDQQSLLLQDTFSRDYYFAPGAKVIQNSFQQGSFGSELINLRQPSHVNPIQINILGEGDFIINYAGSSVLANFIDKNATVYWRGNSVQSYRNTPSLTTNTALGASSSSSTFIFNSVRQESTDLCLAINPNPANSIFTYKFLQHDMIFDQTSQQPRIWLYGTTGADTIRNCSFTYDVGKVIATTPNNRASELGFQVHTGNSGTTRSRFVNAKVAVKVGIIDADNLVMQAGTVRTNYSLYKDVRGSSSGFQCATYFADFRLLEKSDVLVDFEIVKVNQQPHIIFTRNLLVSNSVANYKIVSGRSRYANVFLGDVMTNSSTRMYCGDCVSELDASVVINSTHNATSYTYLEGKYKVLEAGQATLKIGTLYAGGTPNLVLQNLTLENVSGNVIESSVPCTLFIGENVIIKGAVSPNITLVYVGGKWNSQTFTATASQTTFTITGGLPTSTANVRLYNDAGARLRLTDHYTYVPSTGVVTLVTPASAGEKYTVEYFQ